MATFTSNIRRLFTTTIEKAVSVLSRAGRKSTAQHLPQDIRDVVDMLEEIDRQNKVADPRARPPVEDPTATQPGTVPSPAPIGSRGWFSPTLEPPRPGEDHAFSREILTPQSSNVFSFTYDYATSTLFVTYKAPLLHTQNVRTGRGRLGGRQQLRGKLGATVAGKTDERGPLYAYYDVPARVFERMKLAQSKGKFVWNELRVRGTIYGHQYRYALVQGSVTIQGKVSGVYIPRKATPRGFRVRSVADLGQGRRTFQSSTLANSSFRSR